MRFQNQVKFCARMREGNVGARELEERGFMYVGKALTREQTENALSAVDRAFAAEGQGYSRINSNREQVKLGRRMHQMVPALQEAVAVLEAHWLRADPAAGGEMPPLMDVYALRTARDERDDVARAPQAWHLDHYSKFPVAAAILKGQGATEFHCGPYADLASGQRPETLEMWTEEWRTGWKVSRQSARHWRVGSLLVTVHLLLRRPVSLFSDVCVQGMKLDTDPPPSQSHEELAHWTTRLDAAGLLRADDKSLDFDRVDEAAKPECSGAGDIALFWSNKVHRGPRTTVGEERVVLFVSWSMWAASSSRSGVGAASLTDYSFYDWHFKPKLVMSHRALRNARRKRKASVAPAEVSELS